MDVSRMNVIKHVLETYEEVDNVRFENRMLRERLSAYEGSAQPEQVNVNWIEFELIKVGRKVILDECIYSWRGVHIDTDEDGEVKGIQTYESWLEDAIKKDYLPEWISLKAFKEYFEDDLKAMYDARQEKALAALHNEGV